MVPPPVPHSIGFIFNIACSLKFVCILTRLAIGITVEKYYYYSTQHLVNLSMQMIEHTFMDRNTMDSFLRSRLALVSRLICLKYVQSLSLLLFPLHKNNQVAICYYFCNNLKCNGNSQVSIMHSAKFCSIQINFKYSHM